MANTPKTRPPNNHTGGRPRRGPRPVPTRHDLRTQLKAAADRLHTGGEPAPELAEYVRKVMLPGGWKDLRATDTEGSETNLSIRIAERYRDEIAAAAAAELVTLTSVVNEGFEKYLAGEFEPRPRVRERLAKGRRAMGEKMVNLNVTPNAALQGQVRDSNVLPTRVAGDYLMHRFKVGPYAPGYTEPLPYGSERIPKIPRVLRDRIRDEAAKRGQLVAQVIDEGFQKYLAGEFTPVAPEWPKGVETGMLKVRPNNALFDQVKVKGRSESPELRPMQIGLAYVLDKYGIDPSTAE